MRLKHLMTMRNFFEFLVWLGCLALFLILLFIAYFIVGTLIYLLPFLLTVGVIIFVPYAIIKNMMEK